MRILAALVGLLIGVQAWATHPQCVPPDARFKHLHCAVEALKGADTELNTVYQQLLRSMNKDEIDILKAAQRAWITFRDADAVLAFSEAAGENQQVAMVNRQLDLTVTRTKELRQILSTK